MILHPRIKTLSQFVDGDLTKEKNQKIARHIAVCNICAQRIHVLTLVQEINIPAKPLAENFRQCVVDNLPEMKLLQEPRCGIILSIIGIVEVLRIGDPDGIEAFPGLDILRGDTIRIKGKSIALIELNDGSNLYINKDTEISFATGRFPLSLKIGEVFAMMKPQRNVFEIHTPAAVLGVIGTDFDTAVSQDNRTSLKVLKGKVSYQNDVGKIIVPKNQQVEATGTSRPVPVTIKDTRNVASWIKHIKSPKPKKGGSNVKNLAWLIMIVIVAAGLYYFLHKKQEPVTSKPRETMEQLNKTATLKLVPPFSHDGASWRTSFISKQPVQGGKQEIVTKITTRSDVLKVNPNNSTDILLNIESIDVPKGGNIDKAAMNLNGRSLLYTISADGKSLSPHPFDGNPLKEREIDLCADIIDICDISHVFLKNTISPGDTWTDQYSDKLFDIENTYWTGTTSLRFDGYERKDGREYGIIRAHATAKAGGGYLFETDVDSRSTTYAYLDNIDFNNSLEYWIDPASGKLVGGKATICFSNLTGRVVQVIPGRKIPVARNISDDKVIEKHVSFTVDYLK